MTYSFYNRYPKVEINGKTLVDITKRIVMFQLSKSNIATYEKYLVKDSEKPEHVAFKYYGDAGYHWIVLLANDIINPYFGWALSDDELKLFVVDKYGINNENATHHYIASQYSTTVPPNTIVDQYYGDTLDSNGNTVLGTAYRTAISNFEHETLLNDRLREIILIKPEFILEIVNQYEELIKK